MIKLPIVDLAIEATRESNLILAANLLTPDLAPRFATEGRAAGLTCTACMLVLFLVEKRSLVDLSAVRETLR